MAAASAAVRPVVLELGGNDPAVVAPDVEIDDALADKIAGATFITSGQVCMAVKRLYVPEEKVRAMVDALVARVGREVVGDGLAPEVTMGPVHLPQAQRRVEEMLDDAEQRGATVHRPARMRDEDVSAGGYLVSPAIVEGAPDDARIVCEEQFARRSPCSDTATSRTPCAAPTTRPSGCAPRSGRRTGTWPPRRRGVSRPARCS